MQARLAQVRSVEMGTMCSECALHDEETAALWAQGELEEAARILREALEVQRRVLGTEHQETLASANNLADVLADQGEFLEAARIHRETLEVQRRVLGAEHPDTLMSATNLASVLQLISEVSGADEQPRKPVPVAG